MQIPPFRHGEEEQWDWNKQKVSFVKTMKYLDSTFDENLSKIISCNCVRKSSYLKRQMLRTLVFVVIPGVSTYQRTPIRTKTLHLLLWRRPCLSQGTKHFWHIQIYNLTGRTKWIAPLEVRSNNGILLLKSDAGWMSSQQDQVFLQTVYFWGD